MFNFLVDSCGTNEHLVVVPKQPFVSPEIFIVVVHSTTLRINLAFVA